MCVANIHMILKYLHPNRLLCELILMDIFKQQLVNYIKPWNNNAYTLTLNGLGVSKHEFQF